MILVNDETLLIHVPRTGTTYTTRTLRKLGFDVDQRGPQHSTLFVPSHYRTVSFIRNPYSWYPSYYARVTNSKEEITAENFKRDFFLIPSFHKMIARMHRFVDKVYQHHNLISSLTAEFGVEFPDEEINTRLLGTDYTQYYDDELRTRVYMRSREIIDKWGYEFGDP